MVLCRRPALFQGDQLVVDWSLKVKSLPLNPIHLKFSQYLVIVKHFHFYYFANQKGLNDILCCIFQISDETKSFFEHTLIDNMFPLFPSDCSCI